MLFGKLRSLDLHISHFQLCHEMAEQNRGSPERVPAKAAEGCTGTAGRRGGPTGEEMHSRDKCPERRDILHQPVSENESELLG